MDKNLQRALDVFKLMNKMLDTQIEHGENMKKSYEQQIELAKINKENQLDTIEQLETQIKLMDELEKKENE